MKVSAFALLFAACAASARTSSKPATTAKSTTTTHAAAASSSTLPPGVPRVHGIIRTAFSLRYEDVKIGTGRDADPNKMYKVLYTGYLASTGKIFDSSADHRMPVRDKDGKPIVGPDGKPELGDPEPITFFQGFGRVIPGFDQGFTGMKVGGKRRLFIPWQLAYGTRDIPAHGPEHPGIPPKSDLIFDIELVEIADLPSPQPRPPLDGAPHRVPTPAPGAPAGSTPPAASGAAPTPPPSSGTPPTSGTPSTPPPATKPETPTQPATPPPSNQ